MPLIRKGKGGVHSCLAVKKKGKSASVSPYGEGEIPTGFPDVIQKRKAHFYARKDSQRKDLQEFSRS